MLGNHIKECREGLMQIKRYQNKYKHKQRSVAEHSWSVSKIAHGLALWEKNKFKTYDVDIEKVLFMAINHDIVEGFTGDIISTTKEISPILKEELKNVERMIFESHIIKTIPNSWGNMYLDLNKEMSELTTIESKIVKAGDLIDRIYECMEEIDLMNIEPYKSILTKDFLKLRKLDLMSVDYFLKYSIKDIGADKYLPEDVKKYLDSIDFSSYF